MSSNEAADKFVNDPSHADPFIRDGSVSANVDNFESIPEVFSVEKADFVMSGCIRADNVIDSTFEIDENSSKVIAGEGILVNITDCNFTNVLFESKEHTSLINSARIGLYRRNGFITL